MRPSIPFINRSLYLYKRSYRGQVKAVILDWSGTTIDRYAIAPAISFVDVFKKYGVPISMREARIPMGLRKDKHLEALTQMPDIRNRWSKVYNRHPSNEDVVSMSKDFVPIQMECLRNYSTLLPNTITAVKELRNTYKVKIGTTTGFVKEMSDLILEECEKQGYVPDACVSGDEVMNGSRPNPHMLYKNMDLLDVGTIQSVVKVDDTTGGIKEGLEAGCWTVGMARWSNYMEIDSLEEEERMSVFDIKSRIKTARNILETSGAHYVIDEISELPAVIYHINQRLYNGETP